VVVVVIDPVVVVVSEPVVVVVSEPVVGVPVVELSLPPVPVVPVGLSVVTLHARGKRGAIAAATRIQEYFFICCSLEE
jgi:hypothetical protein